LLIISSIGIFIPDPFTRSFGLILGILFLGNQMIQKKKKAKEYAYEN
jgi:hypothetical protein